jgi:hypothetical protein
VVAEERERRDQVRLGVREHLRVRAEHALQQGRTGARRRDHEEELILHETFVAFGGSAVKFPGLRGSGTGVTE